MWRVPVSDQPLPLLPVLKLASLTILPEQLLSSPQSSHSGDAFSVKSSSTSQGLTGLPWLHFDASQRCAASPY